MSVARLAFWIGSAFVAMMVAVGTRGHDFGAAKVIVALPDDGTFRVELTLYPEHMPRDLRPPRDATLLNAYMRRVADGAIVRLDGRAASLTIVTGEAARSGDEEAVGFRLSGPVPSSAAAVTWSHGWIPGQYLVGFARAGETEAQYQWLEGPEQSRPFLLTGESRTWTVAEVVRTYVGLGFTHILPKGLDHILFVLGLFLLSMKAGPLLWQVTAFTVAHSITLALSIYGVVSLPPSVVEPLIALSIAYVAIENIFVTEFPKRRTLVVFAFGLLHGLGFAGVLTELGLPRGQFLPALISFNVGVEFGQLAVLGIAFLAVGVWWHRRDWYRVRVVIPASAVIAAAGLYWTVERVIA